MRPTIKIVTNITPKVTNDIFRFCEKHGRIRPYRRDKKTGSDFMVLLVLVIVGIMLASIDDIITSFVTVLMFIGLVTAIVFVRKKLSNMENDNIYRIDKDKNILR